MSTFQPLLHEGICPGPDEKGVYIVLTADGTIRTKHVRPSEDYFFGLSLIYKSFNTASLSHMSTDMESELDYATYSLNNETNIDK